jgi:hypothetical protein
MPSAVRLREDYSVEELRALARRSKTVNQSRRLEIRSTRWLPHRGHIIRSHRPERDILRHRVQAKVSRLSSVDRDTLPLSACTRLRRQGSAHERASRPRGPRRGSLSA